MKGAGDIMRQGIENYDGVQELYLAGEIVTPGIYRQVGSVREIRIEKEDVLPASLDGHVACYMKVSLWGSIAGAARQLHA